jgi:hypothetical protein
VDGLQISADRLDIQRGDGMNQIEPVSADVGDGAQLAPSLSSTRQL